MGHNASRLLQCVAKAAVSEVPFVGVFAAKVWEYWEKQTAEAKRREELLELARAITVEEVGKLIAQALAGAGVPPERRAEIERVLQPLPATVRAALRRPSDVTGRTVPAGLRITQPADLARFLPLGPIRFSPGDRPAGVGDWVLDELLGVGGFGEVWKVTSPTTRKTAVLKFCTDPDAAAALRNEAEVLSVLMDPAHRHRGVVALLHTYLSADPPCLEYELVEDGNLAGQVMANRELPNPREVAGVVRAVADTVGWMHRTVSPPVVHRDLKPANILVRTRPDGSHEYLVTDFGIGAVVGAGGPAADCLATQIRGAYTPHYASPQQVAGHLPDPRDDVYALGVIWYQLLTGDLTRGRPGGNAWQQRLKERGMRDERVALLVSCFEDDPADRPQDAKELADRLRVLLGPDVAASPAPPDAPVTAPTLSSRLWSVLGKCGLALAGVLGVLMCLCLIGARNDARRTTPSSPTPASFPSRSEHEKAIEEATKEIERQPTASAYINRSRAYLSAGQTPAALKDANDAIRLDPNSALAYAVRAACHGMLGVSEQAIRDAEEAVRLDANCAEAYRARAAAFKEQKLTDKALQDYTQAIRLDPTYASQYVKRAWLQTDPDRAIKDCAEAIRLDPNLAEAYLLRAIHLGNKGAHEAATKDIDEAIRLAPNYAQAHHLRGKAHLFEGRADLAAACFERALALGTLNPAQADAVRKDMESASGR